MAKAGSEADKVVVFRVGQEEYAVSITSVKEVVPWTRPMPIPEAPPLVEGVVDLRGAIIPVVALGRMFRTAVAAESDQARIMIMEIDGQQAGFIVDEVTEVQQVDRAAIAPPSPVLQGRTAPALPSLLLGIFKLGARLIVLIDPARVLEGLELPEVAASLMEEQPH